MSEDRELKNPPPTEIWLGKTLGQNWSVRAFTSAEDVATWLSKGEWGERRAWKVTAMELAEVELVPPAPLSLRLREPSSEDTD